MNIKGLYTAVTRCCRSGIGEKSSVFPLVDKWNILTECVFVILMNVTRKKVKKKVDVNYFLPSFPKKVSLL
jgi:hypothetical protein